MGISIRKSIKAGPFRFNLSGSGVGVSVGVRGLRVGTGPRGNYVHMGRGGLYYRATLPPGRNSPPGRLGDGARNSPSAPRTPGGESFERIESGDVLAMTDESAAGLLKQIREAEGQAANAAVGARRDRGRTPADPDGRGSRLAHARGGCVGGGVTAWAHLRDVAVRVVVLFYDLEPDARAAYEELHVAFARLAGERVPGTWRRAPRRTTKSGTRVLHGWFSGSECGLRWESPVLSAPTLMCRQSRAGRRPCTSSQIASLSRLLVGLERCPMINSTSRLSQGRSSSRTRCRPMPPRSAPRGST